MNELLSVVTKDIFRFLHTFTCQPASGAQPASARHAWRPKLGSLAQVVAKNLLVPIKPLATDTQVAPLIDLHCDHVIGQAPVLPHGFLPWNADVFIAVISFVEHHFNGSTIVKT